MNNKETRKQRGNGARIKLIFLFISYFLTFLLSCFFFSDAFCQSEELPVDGAKRYDEIIDLNSLESIKVKQEAEVLKDELALLLPKLDSPLYSKWKSASEPKVWKSGEALDFVSLSQDLLNELQIEKILKQTYQNENHLVDVLIYKFKDFSGAYSAYTIFKSGATTKLKVGKSASESEKSVSFWKDNFFVNLSTQPENDAIAKEFIILASQDISSSIKSEQLPPVVVVQLPALSRVQGSEKYCTGPLCCKMYFLQDTSDFPIDIVNLKEASGVIKAEYQLSEDPKDKERVSLILMRYSNKEIAKSVFDLLKQDFEKKKEQNKEVGIDVDLDEQIVNVKNKKDDFVAFKQKGNLLAIAYHVINKKSGERILNLVPWPVEIAR